jgi:inositol 1,4,5-triphosphate receptor type 1/inositol 1,4,5-triphosphate receptor type 3
MRTESDQYNIIIQNRFNEEIIFGAEVIFRHIDAEEYLFGSYQCSDFSTDAFKVQLVKLLSSSTVFQLLPYQTFQQEGHPVYIDEPVVI